MSTVIFHPLSKHNDCPLPCFGSGTELIDIIRVGYKFQLNMFDIEHMLYNRYFQGIVANHTVFIPLNLIHEANFCAVNRIGLKSYSDHAFPLSDKN